MKVQNQDKNYNQKDFIKAFLSLEANILINLYTNENVLFGRIKSNDKVPVEQYLEDIGFRNIDDFLDDLFLNGHNIENGYVIERDFNERCFELYRNNMDSLFTDFPLDKSYDDDTDDIYHYKYGLYDYLKNLYPVFEEIIKTEVEPDLYAAMPDLLDKNEQKKYYASATKFVVAILRKKLRQGGRIDRYITKMNFLSPLIKRLIYKRKEHFYLKNSDVYSVDFKLALLSCFWFYNEQNSKLFELKALRWEELKYAVNE